MDELRRKRHSTRRFALAAIIACSTASALADESGSSFRSLLAQGWQTEKAQQESKSSTTPSIATDKAAEQAAEILPQETVAPTAEVPAVESSNPTSQEISAPQATIFRPKSKLLEVPVLPSLESVAEANEVTSDNAAAVSDEQPSNLAQLIKRRTKPIVVPPTKDNSELVVQPAPAVNRLDFDQRIAENASRTLPTDEENIQVVPPIASLLPETEVAEAAPAVEESTAIKSGLTPEVSGEAPSLLALSEITPDAPIQIENQPQSMTPAASIFAARLHKQADESLQTAKERLARGATHSAQKYALEALRLMVSTQDAQVGGNRHTRALDTALDSIREAEDFCGRFGSVDQKALARMIAVHETTVLKEQDLSNFSAIEATEAYLKVARENLIDASANSRHASNALVLLGQIESKVAEANDTYSAAIAVMLQRSATEIDDQNAVAFHALGVTYLQQGLPTEATAALQQSIALQPTRGAYESLLEASRQLGDVDSARACNVALSSNSLPSDVPVRQMSPTDFAATHRPSPQAFQSASAKPETTSTTESNEETPQRVSLRTLFPFSRR